MREAMATARKAIADAKWLSDEERSRALRGLVQAESGVQRQVITKIER